MVLEVFPKESTSNIAVLQFMFRSPGGFQSIFPDTWYFKGTDLGRFVDILIFRETESFNLHHVPIDCAEICLPKNQVFLYQEMLSINKPHHSGGQLNVSTSWTFQVTRHAAITATWWFSKIKNRKKVARSLLIVSLNISNCQWSVAAFRFVTWGYGNVWSHLSKSIHDHKVCVGCQWGTHGNEVCQATNKNRKRPLNREKSGRSGRFMKQ